MLTPQIVIPTQPLNEFCRRNYIRELALFGSVLRDDFHPESDVDVLVDFEPEAPIGLMALGRMQRELSELFARPVDLVPKAGLKPILRETVLKSAHIVYAN